MDIDEAAVALRWRGPFTNTEVNSLHAEAFETRVYGDDEWDWVAQLERHGMGWVTARLGGVLVGFVNVIGDGLVHAWIQDLMVDRNARGHGIGVRLVHAARDAARGAGYEWLHVDFDDGLAPFYLGACGFQPASAGLMALD